MDEEVTTVELYQRLRDTLRRCDAFAKDEALLSTFEGDPRLRPWQDLVPDALNRAERVRLTVALLQDRFDQQGRPALVLLLDVLRDQTDPADQLHEELRALGETLAQALLPAESHPAEGEGPEPAAPGESPFKGLYYYDVDDAENFFGREALTSTLLDLLPHPGKPREEGEAQFLAIVGPSGSGKTSMLRAGLLAVLQDAEGNGDVPSGAAKWPTFLLTPTAQPLQKLAASLTRDDESVRAAAQLADDMKAESRSLSLFAHRLLEGQAASCVLLVVDQLEELFTLCADEAVRRAYLDNLLTACTTGPVLLVTALRSDYYDAAGNYEMLRTLLGRRQVYIGPMSKDELRRVIQEPVLQNGWRFEAGLVDRILDDVGNDPGTLPLLSQALHATWEHREGRRLTHNGYQQAGGVAGAIARSAEAMYESLTAEEQAAARVLLLRMVAPAGGSDSARLPADARVPVPRKELVAEDGMAPAAASALRALARAHLIVEEEGMVALAHEALIRQWARLRRWLNEERQRLALHRRLTMAAQLWQELEQNPDVTYRGEQLQEAEVYAADPAIPLTALEAAFLQESREVVIRQRVEQERRVRAAKRAPLGGALGGGLSYGFSFFLMYYRLFDIGEPLTILLIFYVSIECVLGAVVGAVLVWRLGLEEAAPGDMSSSRALLGGATRGALVFAAFLLVHAFIITDRNHRSWLLLVLAVLQGALWGATSGAGLVWVRASQRPRWQTLAVTALASGLMLMLLNPVTRAFVLQSRQASDAAVFVTGALTPLGILFGAQLASAGLLPLLEKPEPATSVG